jgi:hypothetical protein
LNTNGGTSTSRLVIEDLGLSVDLPTGWELDFDDQRDELQAVGNDGPELVGDLCPSVTVRRLRFTGVATDLDQLTRDALSSMSGSCNDFKLEWSEQPAGGRATRCYSFRMEEPDEVVTQLQGLIWAPANSAVYIINCTAPHATFGSLDAPFRRAVASLTTTSAAP